MRHRKQVGYIFHRGKSWFVRYCDDVLQRDGTIKRKQICKKLDVEYGGKFKTAKCVQSFVDDVLAPINRGLVNVQSTMSVGDFIANVHLPHLAEKKRASTMKGYRDVFRLHLKNRLQGIALRDFRTVTGERMVADIARLARTKHDQPLTHSSLSRVKTFLSGVFKNCKRLGILDGTNPMQDVSTPDGAQAAGTHAYSFTEITKMLKVLPEPARCVVLVAALSGLRKGEIMGLRWDDFDGK